jgi:hypothetical protein
MTPWTTRATGAIVIAIVLVQVIRRLFRDAGAYSLTLTLCLSAVCLIAVFVLPPILQRHARRIVRERQSGPAPVAVAEVVAYRPLGGLGRTAALLVDHDGLRLIRPRGEIVMPWTSIRRTSTLLSYLLGRPWGLVVEADGRDRPLEIIPLSPAWPGGRGVRIVERFVDEVRAARPDAVSVDAGTGAPQP